MLDSRKTSKILPQILRKLIKFSLLSLLIFPTFFHQICFQNLYLHPVASLEMFLPSVSRGRTSRGGCAAKPQAHFGIMEKPLSHVVPAFLSLGIWSQREGKFKLNTH